MIDRYQDMEVIYRDIALHIVDKTNLILRLLAPRYRATIVNMQSEAVRQRMIDIEKDAYTQAGYGDRAEAEELFLNQYRSTQEHGPIVYLGIWDKVTNELVAYFSFFQTKSAIFQQNQDWINTQGDTQKPLFVFSKLVRDPKQSSTLKQSHRPHRLLLFICIAILSHNKQSGVYLETQAQPATMKLLSREVLGKYFPDAGVVLEASPQQISQETPEMQILAEFPKLTFGMIMRAIQRRMIEA